jgi:hypothetical protein
MNMMKNVKQGSVSKHPSKDQKNEMSNNSIHQLTQINYGQNGVSLENSKKLTSKINF